MKMETNQSRVQLDFKVHGRGLRIGIAHISQTIGISQPTIAKYMKGGEVNGYLMPLIEKGIIDENKRVANLVELSRRITETKGEAYNEFCELFGTRGATMRTIGFFKRLGNDKI